LLAFCSQLSTINTYGSSITDYACLVSIVHSEAKLFDIFSVYARARRQLGYWLREWLGD